MDKFKKNSKLILIIFLVVIGGIAAVFGKNIAVQCGVSFLCWGLAILVLTWVTYNRNQQEMNSFDEDANEILQDLAVNGEESEYYYIYNVDMIAKMRKKLVKHNNKQIVGCAVIGIAILIIGIVLIA